MSLELHSFRNLQSELSLSHGFKSEIRIPKSKMVSSEVFYALFAQHLTLGIDYSTIS